MNRKLNMNFNFKGMDKVLERHAHWLNEDVEGWENMRAELCSKLLDGEDLKGINLKDGCLLPAMITS